MHAIMHANAMSRHKFRNAHPLETLKNMALKIVVLSHRHLLMTLWIGKEVLVWSILENREGRAGRDQREQRGRGGFRGSKVSKILEVNKVWEVKSIMQEREEREERKPPHKIRIEIRRNPHVLTLWLEPEINRKHVVRRKQKPSSFLVRDDSHNGKENHLRGQSVKVLRGSRLQLPILELLLLEI